MLKLYSWNVNGLRAIHKKGFIDWLKNADPDILCLQETRAAPDQLEWEIRYPGGYHAYWAAADRKGYSGVAIFTKQAPKTVQIGLGIPKFDAEGRTLVADYGEFVLIGAYFPNGGRDLSRVPFKMEYKAAFLDFCQNLRAQGRAIIFCGDVNTAHQEIDLARPKENTKTTGFLPVERAWMDQVVGLGYVDIFRQRNPTLGGAYTWWSARSGAKNNNVGWRIDYFFLTPDLLERVADAAIHPTITGSDHCPVSLILK